MSQPPERTSDSGYVYALGSAITAGLIPIFSKLLLANTKPLTISAVTFLVAGLVILPVRPRVSPGKASLRWMLVSGFLGSALAPVLYLYGINQTSAVNAALLTNAEVFFTGVLAFVVFGERLKKKQLLEGLLVVGGIVVVSTGMNLDSVQLLSGFTGNLLIVAASLVWAVDNNVSRITSQRFGEVFVSKFRNILGGGMILIFLLLTANSIVVQASAVPVLLLYGGDMALATLTFMGALVRIGAVRTLLVFSTTSIFGSAFAVSILGESITRVQMGGGALILLGVYLIQRSESR